MPKLTTLWENVVVGWSKFWQRSNFISKLYFSTNTLTQIHFGKYTPTNFLAELNHSRKTIFGPFFDQLLWTPPPTPTNFLANFVTKHLFILSCSAYNHTYYNVAHQAGCIYCLKGFWQAGQSWFLHLLGATNVNRDAASGKFQIIVREIIIWTNNSSISQFPDILCSLGFPGVYIIQLLTAALSHCR